MSAGADGFLIKGCPSQELFAEIQRQGQPRPEVPRMNPEKDGTYHQGRMQIAVSTG
jgi:hypothetical protein